jgi:hypothetical protein
MTNISGEFEIELKGTTRKMKATFAVIEKLENSVFLNSSVTEKFFEAFNGKVRFSNMVDVFHVGLAATHDTRLSREEVAEAILDGGGVTAYLATYIQFLQYFIDGGKPKEKSNPL